LAAAPELTGALPTYIAADRRQAMSDGRTLPDRQRGTVLFADIGGFTPLTEAMEQSFGLQRGAEELAMDVNGVFDALVDAVSRHHGSIVSFGGDSLTCWFEDGRELSAVACACEMQAATAEFGSFGLRGAGALPVSLKVGLSHGEARRFMVGDPQVQLHDVVAGTAVDHACAGERLCRPGEIMVERALVSALADAVSVKDSTGEFVRVTGLRRPVAADPWPVPVAQRFDDYVLQAWMAPAVYAGVRAGQGRFLAEFRPVAVLFVAFGGIDYEDGAAGAALDAFIRRTQDIVMRDGGSVFDISMGDKGSYLLAVFGAPVARGDDVRRAVGAAHHLRRGHDGELRIGVHAGRAYAGLYAGRWRSAYTVLGDTVNLGARLMMTAQPGQILMSAGVGVALDRRFSIRALDPIRVKGRSAPVAVCELVGPSTADRSLTEPRYALPMVNRERELQTIDEALATAKNGRGDVLALSADPGVGKSRLIDAAIGRAMAEGFTTFAGACQPYGGRIAYLPWQPIWNAVFGLAADAPDATRRPALMSALVADIPDAIPLAPLLGTALDLGMEDNDATRGMPAPVRKQLLEQILTGVLRARAATGPVCIVLEDLHWVDSLSRDLLEACAAAIADVPVLILLAYRPPDVEAAGALRVQREIELEELGEDEASALATMLLAHMLDREPKPATVAAITERASGNPFYIEELVREVVERGSTSDLPTSLESLILGRLDRLSDSQRLLARMASVIGRRFPTQWLIGAYGNTLDSTRIPLDLIALTASGLMVADTPPPDEAYLFRHIVVRDVAYETLGFRLRQDLHEQLAAYLEHSSEAPPVDLLAYHYARSANSTKEVLYRRLAAELAIHNGAYGDALAHVQRASKIVVGQPEGAEKVEQELELALLLGSILLVTDGQGSAKAKAVYDRARALSAELPPGPAVGRAIFGLWTYYLFQGLMGPTAELADEAVALAERSPDAGVRIMAHLAVAQTHMWTGHWGRCVDHFAQVLELYDPAHHQAYITQYAQNPRFTASNSGFWGEWMLGHTERAAAVAEEAIADARELHHEFTYTIAFLGRPLGAWFRRHDDVFLGSVDEYVATAQRSGNPFYVALSLSLHAMAKIVRGEFDAGLAQLTQQYETMHALGSNLCDPLVVSLLAEGYLRAGRYGEGIALLDDTLPSFERDGRISHAPDHLRLRAELLSAQDPEASEEALALLVGAIDIARSHNARSFELRAALSAARLLGTLGREEEAQTAVGAAYAGFTEGFDDPDLREARVFLSYPLTKGSRG
jgi:adenylate cyclase